MIAKHDNLMADNTTLTNGHIHLVFSVNCWGQCTNAVYRMSFVSLHIISVNFAVSTLCVSSVLACSLTLGMGQSTAPWIQMEMVYQILK